MHFVVERLLSDVTLVIRRLESIERNNLFNTLKDGLPGSVGNSILSGIATLTSLKEKLLSMPEGIGSRLHTETVLTVDAYNTLYFKHTTLVTRHRIVELGKFHYIEGMDINDNYAFIILRNSDESKTYLQILHTAFVWIRKTDTVEKFTTSVHDMNYGLRPISLLHGVRTDLCDFEIIHKDPVDVELCTMRDRFIQYVEDTRQ